MAVDSATIYLNNLNEKVSPAFSKSNIAICLFFSNDYAPHGGVLIQSILCNSSNKYNYDIFVLERAVSDTNKKKILSLATEYANVSLRFLNLTDLAENINVKIHSQFALEGCLKLYLLSDIFELYEKIVALDSDLVLERDIADLFNIDLSEKYLAATDDVLMKSLLQTTPIAGGNAPKISPTEYISDYLGYGSSNLYLNTGVVVLNLRKCREDKLFTKAIWKINNKDYWFLEQDVLNELCGENAYLLPLRWNALHGSKVFDKICSCLDRKTRKEYIDAVNHPYIMHFAGGGKPWTEPDVLGAEYYYKYAFLTPWYPKNSIDVMSPATSSGTKETHNIIKPLFSEQNRRNVDKIKESFKKFLIMIFPAYRVALRLEEKLQKQEMFMVQQRDLLMSASLSQTQLVRLETQNPSTYSKLTGNLSALIDACWALEIHETHKRSFVEFKNCNIGKNVVIIATGPTLQFFEPIEDAVYIGVNKAYQYDKVELDYYFLQDYSQREKKEWIHDLKDYDFVKFFGQYTHQAMSEALQIPRCIAEEANARRYFSNFPRLDIPVNIEYFPLMEFHSIVFPAIHFALYTNPKRIFLVGCDTTTEGYYDGSKRDDPNIDYNTKMMLEGYRKLKTFVNIYFPNTEIISINPVGLKSLFRDVFTEGYLKRGVI